MGFKQLFKVRQPGHGESFEKRVMAAISESKARVFPSKTGKPNGGDKQSIKK